MTSHRTSEHGRAPDAVARAEATAEQLLRGRARRRQSAARVFERDQLVAGRYRIIELLERGGAGQVYRAHDQELGEQVALKTLHPGIAASPQALDRFKQEVLLARSVSHENVCRLFELGRHQSSEETNSVLFLIMELIEGETLADFADRCAPLPFEQVVELGRQVALGLRAAHKKGVIHRDLKGQNVLVEASPDESGGNIGRAVLTDFGLAISPPPMLEVDAEDQPRAVLEGTPLTMAPEQVRGEPVGVAADIYGLGVLLYHLSTARYPFEGETPLATALLRLEQAPKEPRHWRRDMPAALERLILDCLRIDPAERPESMDRVLERLKSALIPEIEIPPSPSLSSGWKPRRLMIAAIALMGLLATGLWWFPQDDLWPARSGAPDSTNQPVAAAAPAGVSDWSAAVKARPSILWLGFSSPAEGTDEADSAELEWLKALVEQGLLASLSATGDLRLVAGERALKIRRELDRQELERWQSGPSKRGRSERGRSELGPLAADLVARLRQRAGVDKVLSGSATSLTKGSLRLELRLEGQAAGQAAGQVAGQVAGDVARPDAEAGVISHIVSIGDLSGLGDEIAAMADQVRARLELPEPTPDQESIALAEIPRQAEAARLYAQALVALRRFETKSAVDLLQRSLEAEPEHAKVLSTLAAAWFQLGHGHQARLADQAAFESSAGLSRPQQLLIEARYRMRRREWQRAEQLHQALWEFFPDEAEHGLGVLEAQDRAGALEPALATLEKLKARTPRNSQGRHDPRFDLAESMLAYHQGDYPRSQEAARRARQSGEQLAAPALIAEALTQEALTRISTDADLAPVEAMLNEAKDLLEQIGEQRSLVTVQLYLGDCARRRDHFPAAEAAYRQAIERASAIGHSASLDRGRTSLAILLDRQGRLRQGLVLKQEVLQSYRQRHVEQGAVIAQENVAISLLKMGQPAEALRRLGEVEQRYQELGDRIGLTWSPYYQGRAWLDSGELELAAQQLARAKEAANPADGERAAGLDAAVDYERARLALMQGELETARALLLPLVPFYQSLEQPSDVAETRLALARVSRQQARWQEAEQSARAALEHYDRARISHQTLAARAELAEIEMDRFRTSEPGELPATPDFVACGQLPPTSGIEHRRFALLASLTALRCEHAMASPLTPILAQLDAIIDEAKRLQLFLPELRARILRAQIHGSTPAAEQDLKALTREAAERGFGAMASLSDEQISTQERNDG